MRSILKSFSIIALLSEFYFSLSVGAAVQSLNWRECLQLAAQNNSDILAAERALHATKLLEAVPRSGYFPQLGLSTTASQAYLGSSVVNPANTGALSLQLTQNLFAGFADQGKIRQATENSKAAEAKHQLVILQVYSELKQAYAELLYSQELVRLAQKIKTRRYQNLRIVQLRFNSGRENKGAVLLSEAYEQQADYEKVLADKSRIIASSNLASMLGLQQVSESSALAADIEVQDLPVLTNQVVQEPVLLPLVEKSNELLASLAQENSLQAAADTAKSAFWPSLDLSASVGKIDSQYLPALAPVNDKWSVALTLTWTLFAGGKNSANWNAAFANWQAQQQTRIAKQKSIMVKLQQAYLDYQLSAKKYAVDEKFKAAASLRAEIARNKYNNGLLTFELWDQTESDFILREKNALNAQRERILSEARWQEALGTVPSEWSLK